jgi:hypothetical protein
VRKIKHPRRLTGIAVLFREIGYLSHLGDELAVRRLRLAHVDRVAEEMRDRFDVAPSPGDLDRVPDRAKHDHGGLRLGKTIREKDGKLTISRGDAPKHGEENGLFGKMNDASATTSSTAARRGRGILDQKGTH